MKISLNYRVFNEDNGDYVIREVIYAEDGSIVSCTKNAVEPTGRTLEELTSDIEAFKQALTLPVLTLADIPTTEVKKEKLHSKSKNISHKQLLEKLGFSHTSTSS